MDKRAAVAEINKHMCKKWKHKILLSDKFDLIQNTFSEPDVGKRYCYGERDRSRFAKSLLCGHSQLNYHLSKINNNKSQLCLTCKVPETMEHFLFDCLTYKEEKKYSRELLRTSLTEKSFLAVS